MYFFTFRTLLVGAGLGSGCNCFGGSLASLRLICFLGGREAAALEGFKVCFFLFKGAIIEFDNIFSGAF